MHVVVTGANGFVGKALVARLLKDHASGQRPLSLLTLVDVGFDKPPGGQVRQLEGSIADADFVAQAFEPSTDMVFHLASIPGGTAEGNHPLSRAVNLQGTEHLLEASRRQVERGDATPRFVFASTIAVYGSPMPATVDDTTPLNPAMTYGAQKLVGEVLVADYSRRQWVDGCSLRLAGVLARPPAKTGQLSAFMSDIIHALSAGRPFTCPTSPQASTWGSSVHTTVQNLLHAAEVDSSKLPARRSLLLPCLHFTMGELVEAIGVVSGQSVHELVRWEPDERIEALFGRFPPLTTDVANAAGFQHDGDLLTLVRQAIAPI